jgi:hypothetical protein
VGPRRKPRKLGDTNFMGQVIPGIEPKALRGLADEQMKALGGGVVAIIAANENANTVVVAVSPELDRQICCTRSGPRRDHSDGRAGRWWSSGNGAGRWTGRAAIRRRPGSTRSRLCLRAEPAAQFEPGGFFQLPGLFDGTAEFVALFVDRCDHRPHRYPQVNQHRFG